MTHVQVAAGIRKHRQAIEFFLAWIFFYAKAVVLVPIGLSCGFNGLRIILDIVTTHFFLLRKTLPLLICKNSQAYPRAGPSGRAYGKNTLSRKSLLLSYIHQSRCHFNQLNLPTVGIKNSDQEGTNIYGFTTFRYIAELLQN